MTAIVPAGTRGLPAQRARARKSSPAAAFGPVCGGPPGPSRLALRAMLLALGLSPHQAFGHSSQLVAAAAPQQFRKPARLAVKPSLSC